MPVETLMNWTVPCLPRVSKFTTTASGLRYRDLREGDGPTPKAGDMVEVHYTGWLTDGKQFDSSRSEGRKPIKFPLGQGDGDRRLG